MLLCGDGDDARLDPHILTATCIYVCFKCTGSFLIPAAPERLPTPRGRATAPHSSPRCPRQQNGRRRHAPRAEGVESWSPCVANNKAIRNVFWVSGTALDSGVQTRGFKSPRLCFFSYFFFFLGG